ncbi:catalase [Methanolobus halotolerans]|uniref:Catalase n=1 Tax=Methanolobus halotolerans TaxID=2052935 RepID=A0A4E0PYB4_9EURY|nr:catalase [Methanolobus halotolerans]TGC09869.1 catalase HPII [Methanolobus halotolerans]
MNKRRVDENSKNEQLEQFNEDKERELLTTNQGLRVDDTDISLKAGERGPTLLEDFHFREKLTHFDHERIPERVVHARGSGAHGYFQVYEPLTEYTFAKFLQDPEKKTPVFVRFSTVVGFRGSADTVRDVRGFATKFYTEEGNYDIVGNNIPVFFIQDAMKFPDLVHAIKPEQDNQIPQASAAHDTFWDFVAQHPENAHMIMWLLSDRGIPRSYRMMQGFGVNTFRFVNAEGKGRFIKFHWRPILGIHSLVWDEAQKLAGKDSDFNRRDLWEAIETGNYPEFEMGVQLIEEEDELNFDFDILDPTKIWPEEEVPVKWIGKMTLNRNPDNFFAETEQVAFCPANIVPGIDFSNDPLLQGRLFSYLDTQLIRLGGPNFQEIPINRPLAPVSNNQREGYNRMTINKGKGSYFPNTVAKGLPRPASSEEGGYVHYMEKVEGRKIRARSEKFKDFYSQAKLFWNSMSEPEKMHIVKAFHFEIGKVKDRSIRQGIVDMFNNVDGDLAIEIAKGVGADAPKTKGGSPVTKKSRNVSQELSEHTRKDTVMTRKIAILAATGYNHSEVESVKKALIDAGAQTEIISKFRGMLKSSQGKEMEVDKNYEAAESVMYDAIYIPGGQESISSLKMHGDAVHFINEAFRHCKPIGATGDGVDLLASSDVTGVEFAGDGTDVVSDKGIVTVRDPMDGGFNESFIAAIAQHRHWDRESKMQVPA